MSVEFPKKMGMIQSLVNLVTGKINDLSKKFDSDKLNFKKPNFNLKIAAVVEQKKFEPPAEYIANNYPNGIQTAAEVVEMKCTLECDEAMRKLQDKLDGITKMIMEKSGELDKLMEQLNEFLDPIKEYLKLIQDLLNMSINIDTVVTAVLNLIKLVAFVFTMSIRPIIDIADSIYKMYRELKVMAGVQLTILSSLYEIKCVTDCKYSSDQASCPVLKKLKLSTCPLLKVMNPVINIGANLESTIDAATSPIDKTLEIVNSIIGQTPINKFINREYPPVTVAQVKQILSTLAADSHMNQEGVISQPDTESEMKPAKEE